jgi:hypothetical protein
VHCAIVCVYVCVCVCMFVFVRVSVCAWVCVPSGEVISLFSLLLLSLDSYEAKRILMTFERTHLHLIIPKKNYIFSFWSVKTLFMRKKSVWKLIFRCKSHSNETNSNLSMIINQCLGVVYKWRHVDFDNSLTSLPIIVTLFTNYKSRHKMLNLFPPLEPWRYLLTSPLSVKILIWRVINCQFLTCRATLFGRAVDCFRRKVWSSKSYRCRSRPPGPPRQWCCPKQKPRLQKKEWWFLQTKLKCQFNIF